MTCSAPATGLITHALSTPYQLQTFTTTEAWKTATAPAPASSANLRASALKFGPQELLERRTLSVSRRLLRTNGVQISFAHSPQLYGNIDQAKMWPKDNPESWRQIHEFIAELPDDEYWSRWKSLVRDVVSALEARGLVPLFRIGQGMHHIILSTSERHGLTSEPRVTLEFHPKEQIIRIAYGQTNLYFNEPMFEERVAPSVALPSILRYLRRLWSETKPDTQIPDALNTA